MKYKLNIIKDNCNKVWIYDNQTSEIFDENGNQLLTEYNYGKFQSVIPFTRDYNQYIKGKDNYLLEICLGLNCNFNCKYCSQKEFRNQAYNSKPSDVEEFINLLVNSGIKCHRIQLWGGEPLIYWKTIEKLVPELRRMYPEAHISAPSNGSLLTRDKVDFMKKYDMYLYISHDGCDNSKRIDKHDEYRDILDDPVVLDSINYARSILASDKIAFGVTPTHGNTNVEHIIKFFRNKFKSNINVSTHNIVRCHNSFDEEQVKFSTLSNNDLKEYSESVFNVLNYRDQYPEEYSLHRKLDYFINTLIFKEPFDAIRAECELPFSTGMIVDMKGNILQCHNHSSKVKYGHLSDLSKATPLGYNHLSNKERCRGCLIAHGCKGGCPSADDKANELACPNLYALWYGIFKSAIAALFGAYLVSVEKI